ncbi:MAG: AEC family transporter [Haloarculaceae archaeon]
MALFGRLLFMLATLGVGFGARWYGVLDEERTDRLNWLAFYVALPALIFASTHDRALGEIVTPPLLAGLWIVLLTVVGLSWLVHRTAPSRGERSVAIVQSYHSNFGYLGLPLVAATMGGTAAAKASVILGVGALTQVPLTILFLITINDADAAVHEELGSLATNPVILSLAAGLTVAATGLPVPQAAVGVLAPVGQLALPIALLCVGASLQIAASPGDFERVGSVVALKVFLMPALAWVAFTLLGADTLTLQTAVVMFATPTAVSTFIYANELGGDADLASLNVFATTVVSLGTLFVLLRLFV